MVRNLAFSKPGFTRNTNIPRRSTYLVSQIYCLFSRQRLFSREGRGQSKDLLCPMAAPLVAQAQPTGTPRQICLGGSKVSVSIDPRLTPTFVNPLRSVSNEDMPRAMGGTTRQHRNCGSNYDFAQITATAGNG